MIPMAPGFFRPVGSSTDPSVLVLLQGDGDNGSSSLIDSSVYERTVTGGTGVVNSTEQFKFGTASIKVPANQWIRVPPSSDFNFASDEWQFDVWVYSATHSLPDDFRWMTNNVVNGNTLTSAVESGSVIGLAVEGISNDYYTSTGWNGVGFNSTWRLFTFSRAADDVFRIWINGTLVYGATLLGSYPINWSQGTELSFMQSVNSTIYVDSLRLMSRADWNTSTNYDVPTSAFTP